MVYVATLLLAVGLLAGFLGIYDLGVDMQLGFYAFWSLVVAAVAVLGVAVARHKRRHFLE